VLDAVRNRDGDRADERREGRNARSEVREGRAEPRRANGRRLTDRDIDERLSRVQSYGTGRNRSQVNRSNRRGNAPMRAGNPQQRNLITASPERPAVSSSQTGRAQPRSNAERRRNITGSETRQSEPRRTETRRNISRPSSPPRAETRREQPRSNAQRRRDITRSEPRRSESRRSEPRRQSNPRPKRTSQPTRRMLVLTV